MIPRFDKCIVCEGVREELHGKMTILGFLGICPDVDLGLSSVDQPAVMTFILLGTEGDGAHSGWVEIYDETTHQVIASTTPMAFVARPDSRTLIGAQIGAIFGRYGTFAVRLFIEGVERFRSTFTIRPPTQSVQQQHPMQVRAAVAG